MVLLAVTLHTGMGS